jgi:hypothetical protein
MTGWWSLDEPNGAAKAKEHCNGLVGDWVNGCVDMPGMVARSKYFDFSWGTSPGNQYVEIPYSPLFDMGTGDFSMDAWILRTSQASLFVVPAPIFCRADSWGGKGYCFEIIHDHVALQMGAGPPTTTTFEGTTSILDQEWHHVAVTVKREDQTSPVGTFYLDGYPDGTFVPLTDNLDLINVGSFGEALIGHGWCGNAYISPTGSCGIKNPEFLGQLDEVELFRRALTADEVHSIWAAAAAGKCQMACYLPEHLTACANESASGNIVICNISNADMPVTWNLISPNFSPLGCTAPNPTSFSPSSGSITVPANDCVTIPFTVTASSVIPAGQAGCYQLKVIAGDTYVCETFGKLWGKPDRFCWQRVSTAMTRSMVDTVRFTIANTGGTVDTAYYSIGTVVPATGAPDSVVRLNGALPGTPVLGAVPVAASSSENVAVTFEFSKYLPLETREVVLYRRDPVTSALVPAASAIVQSVAAIVPHVHDCNTNGIADSVDIAHGTSIDSNGNGVPDECENASCGFTAVGPDAGGAARMRFLGGAPNPSRGAMRLSLSSGGCASVELSVADVAGRVVRRWSLSTSASQVTHVEWNGADDSGQRLSAGVYFVKLRGACGSSGGMVVLAR